jgi:hypothetical protein
MLVSMPLGAKIGKWSASPPHASSMTWSVRDGLILSRSEVDTLMDTITDTLVDTLTDTLTHTVAWMAPRMEMPPRYSRSESGTGLWGQICVKRQLRIYTSTVNCVQIVALEVAKHDNRAQIRLQRPPGLLASYGLARIR